MLLLEGEAAKENRYPFLLLEAEVSYENDNELMNVGVVFQILASLQQYVQQEDREHKR